MSNRAYESEANMQALEEHISGKSYMTGYQPTLIDTAVYSSLNINFNDQKETNVCDKALLLTSRVTYLIIHILAILKYL